MEETEEAEKRFTSISEFSVNMSEPKRRNDVFNVMEINNDAAQKMKDTCEMYINEFPQLMEEDSPLFLQAIEDLNGL